ncbi:MAG: helix-turn-helix transcriptional regulator [Clostridiales bacterium]|nr:helix-turn-helix transcriptional regulator [Clostridiales bacterium]
MSSMLNNLHVINWINSLQITMTDSGYAELGTEWCRTDVRSPYTRIYYIHHGNGYAYHDGVKTIFKEGYMYMIPIGFHYDYGCYEKIDQLYFHITITQPNGYDLFSQCNKIYELPVDKNEIERLVLLYRSPDMVDALSIACCLYRDVAAFITEADMEAKPAFAYSEMIQKLFPIIRNNLSSKLTIQHLATEMRCSTSTLTKRFRIEMEMTLGSYIDSMLFQKAQQLLLFTDLSICEISDMLRFCDQFYFSRYFKQHQNETPSHYRKRLKASV